MSKPAEVLQEEALIESLFDSAKNLEDEIQAHFARYLCIRIAGYLEVSVRLVFEQYVKQRCQVEVFNYVRSELKKVRNPDWGRVVGILGSFSAELRARVKKAVDLDLTESADSIIRNRNQIAHGADTDITLLRLRPWYNDTTRLIEILAQECR